MGPYLKPENHSTTSSLWKKILIAFSVFLFIALSAGFLWLYLSMPSHLSSHAKKERIILEDSPVSVGQVFIPKASGDPLVVIDDGSFFEDKKPEPIIIPEGDVSVFPGTPAPHPTRIRATWEINAAPFPALSKDFARIAIVIDDIGLHKGRAEAFIDLPSGITLSFLPYGNFFKSHLSLAKMKGHDILLHVPMENKTNATDTGPNALKRSMPAHEIKQLLNRGLDDAGGIVGINNHMGSAFTQSSAGMTAVMDVLKKRGFFFLDSLTTGQSKGKETAKKTSVPFMTRDVFLDNVQEVDYVLRQLGQLEKVAVRRGYAIGIGHPYPVTLNALKIWMPTLEKKKIILVPLSALYMEQREAEEKKQESR